MVLILPFPALCYHHSFRMPPRPPQPEPASASTGEEPQGPRVSVILVTFNQAPALRRAVEALERSTGRERIEIVVVDCGSQDESASIDTDHPTIQVLRLPHHIGAGRAMNIATRTAKADLVLYLSPDIEVEPNTVSALADRLEPESNLVAVCPLVVDGEGRPSPRVFALPGPEALAAAARGVALQPVTVDATQESITVEYPSLEAVMVRKVFIRGMNYFDQRYGHYWADLDLAMQARRAGKKILLYPAIRARRQAAPDPLEGEPLAAIDRVTGAIGFLNKYVGTGAGIKLRLGAALGALARLDFGAFSGILGGTKLDGTEVR